MSGLLPNNAVVLVHGIARAAAQGLWNLLWQLRHLVDGRKARDRDQGGGELEVSICLTTPFDEPPETALQK